MSKICTRKLRERSFDACSTRCCDRTACPFKRANDTLHRTLLSALRASIFFLHHPVAARCALATGYPMPRLRRSNVDLTEPGDSVVFTTQSSFTVRCLSRLHCQVPQSSFTVRCLSLLSLSGDSVVFQRFEGAAKAPKARQEGSQEASAKRSEARSPWDN